MPELVECTDNDFPTVFILTVFMLTGFILKVLILKVAMLKVFIVTVFMLTVFMLTVFMLTVFMLTVFMLTGFILKVFMLRVFMLPPLPLLLGLQVQQDRRGQTVPAVESRKYSRVWSLLRPAGRRRPFRGGPTRMTRKWPTRWVKRRTES